MKWAVYVYRLSLYLVSGKKNEGTKIVTNRLQNKMADFGQVFFQGLLFSDKTIAYNVE